MLIEPTPAGLYCSAGGFHIDPWRAVDRAVITHAHGDHLSPGSQAYLCSASAGALVRHRLGTAAGVETLSWQQSINLNGVTVSFAPAGHILGSAQVRLEHRGEVWVASGDYKRAADPLVPVAKAYSGLTDAEIDELDRWIWRHSTERFGPVSAVEPFHVFELGFERIAESTRHRSGVAVRFPRILRGRRDKTPSEVDTLETLRRLLP